MKDKLLAAMAAVNKARSLLVEASEDLVAQPQSDPRHQEQLAAANLDCYMARQNMRAVLDEVAGSGQAEQLPQLQS